MNKYELAISKLKSKGIEFEKGLTAEEIATIEQRYDICFPIELKNFYSVLLPVSDGFYNWRNASESSVEMIKRALEMPLVGLLQDLEELYWCDEWGEEPGSIEEKKMILAKLYEKAPKLIPVYSHRYMPYLDKEEEMPIFSIYQSDIIYYGENLLSYFEIEFGLKHYSDMKCDNIPHIDFWSDLI